MTQAALAKKLGVTQPSYHRWETGSAPIPDGKLKKLATILDTSPEALLGKHDPIEPRFHDDAADHLKYYGEVAIHFTGGGKPLLLSISEQAFSDLHRDLQLNLEFVSVKSLANQTVAIRTQAVSDLYFSSDAYDTFGPEHAYTDYVPLLLPDSRDWKIVEALEHEIGIEEFDDADVQRVRKMIMIADDQHPLLVSQSHIKAEDSEQKKRKNEEKVARIFKAASTTTYQLSTGQQRDVSLASEEDLYHAFCGLVEFDESVPLGEMILLTVEGAHRVIFICKDALDFVSIPSHLYEAGSAEALAVELDEN